MNKSKHIIISNRRRHCCRSCYFFFYLYIFISFCLLSVYCRLGFVVYVFISFFYMCLAYFVVRRIRCFSFCGRIQVHADHRQERENWNMYKPNPRFECYFEIFHIIIVGFSLVPRAHHVALSSQSFTWRFVCISGIWLQHTDEFDGKCN